MSTQASLFQRLSRIADTIIDERVGLIERVYFIPREPGAPNFFHCAALACRTQNLGYHANFRAAGGASPNRHRAAAKAIGEAVERYCSAIYETDDLPLYSYSSAPFSCAEPESFALYLSWQYSERSFPYVPFGKDTIVRWVAATEVTTESKTYVPAAAVFMPYHFVPGSGDEPILQPISTGLACHCSYSEAALAAICEAIERDAFTLTWQTKSAPPQIRTETLSDDNYDLVRRFEQTGDSLTLFDITTDIGIPTLLSVSRNESSTAPAFVAAAAASLDPEEAMRKSLEELAHTRRYSQQLKSRMDRLPPDLSFANIMSQVDHLNFWCDHANLHLADFLFRSNRRLEFSALTNLATGDPRHDLIAANHHLRQENLNCYLVDLTTPDVADLGLFVVRAVVPGLHPLCMGFRVRALAGKRLNSRLGQAATRDLDRSFFLEDVPHPYP